MAASADRALDNTIDPEDLWKQLDHIAHSSLSGLHGALSDQPLCEQCVKLDFNELLDPTKINLHEGRSVVWITSTEPRICVFCRMLWLMGACRIANDHQRRSTMSVFKAMELRAYRIPFDRSLSNLGEKEQILLTLGSKSYPNFLREGSMGHFESKAYAAMLPIQRPDHTIDCLKRHPARNALLNYERISSWIKECDKHHHKRCYTPYKKTPYTIKCIDCWTNTVVTLPITTKYFALSYVWGSSSRSGPKSQRQNQPSAQTPQNFPRTIRDAMFVVNRLGGRYLWVDQFCINQEDAAEKHEQISKMRDIYSSAWLTIITSANEDSDTHIPGVSAARAESLFVGGSHKLELRFVQNGMCLRTEICKTRWATRGWTYQEFILSRRCLILTSQRAHFLCNVSVRSELDEEHTLPQYSNASFSKLDCLEKDKSTRNKNVFQSFRSHLRRYSERSLSFDSDYLNAFKGIIEHLKTRTVWGLPLYTLPLWCELPGGPSWEVNSLEIDKLTRMENVPNSVRYHMIDHDTGSVSSGNGYLNALKEIPGRLHFRKTLGLPLWGKFPEMNGTPESISAGIAFILLHNVCHKAGNGPILAESGGTFLHDRIDCIPSWTWAGWKGGKLVERFLWTMRSENEPMIDCSFQIQLKNGRRMAIAEYYGSHYDEVHLSHSLFIRGSCWTLQLRLTGKEYGMLWEIEDIGMWQLSKREDAYHEVQVFWDIDDRKDDPRPSFEPYPVGDWQADGDLVTCSGLCLMEYRESHSSGIRRSIRFLLFVERQGKACRIGVLQMSWDLTSWLEDVWRQEKDLKQRTLEFI